MSSEVKGYLLTAAVVLITIGLYNSYVKTALPTQVRNFVGLG